MNAPKNTRHADDMANGKYTAGIIAFSSAKAKFKPNGATIPTIIPINFLNLFFISTTSTITIMVLSYFVSPIYSIDTKTLLSLYFQ